MSYPEQSLGLETMDEKIEAFQKEFSKITDECQRFCFMSRAKELQLEACEKLSNFRKEASTLKKQMVAVTDEDSANAMLSFERTIDALIDELKMWIALKDDDPNSAWNHLINAQDAVRTAILAHHEAYCLEGYIERLHVLEQLLFPPQIFMSSSMAIESQECSICGEEYGECNHIMGKAYTGRMCTLIIKKIKELKEVSVVSEPADKKCRVYNITDADGVKRDFMTWRIIS